MIAKAAATAGGMRLIERTRSVIERRQVHRIHTVCRFAKVAGCGDEGLWRVCNISDSGVMFKSRCRASPGDPLSVSLSEGVTLEAVVMWSDAEHCGARFIARVDSTALLCALATEQRSPGYRALRLAVDGRALAFDEAGVHAVRVRNISRHGVGLDHSNRLRRGTTIKLVFSSGVERRGIVRWADQEQAGLFLLEPFTPDEMASARSF